MQKGHFENGELINGLRRDFFHDGTLEKEGNVKNAKYEGPVKEYYFDGKLLFEGEYANGDKNGKGVIYHKNGKQKQLMKIAEEKHSKMQEAMKKSNGGKHGG